MASRKQEAPSASSASASWAARSRKNLVAAGWRVIGYDIDAGAARAMAQAPASRSPPTPPTSRARRRSSSPACRSRRRSPRPSRAIAAAKLPRRVIVEMQHLHARRQGKRRDACCARPATSCSTARSAAPARRPRPRTSSSMPAATPKTIKQAQADVRRLSAAHVYDVGAFGNGSRMKYVANLLVAIHNVASAEAMVLGMKAGLPPQLIFDLINAGAGNSRVFELRAPMMVKDNYDDATMKIDGLAEGHGRDRRLRRARSACRRRCSTPPSRSTPRRMKSGHGAQDTAAVCAVLEKMAASVQARSAQARPSCPALVPGIHVLQPQRSAAVDGRATSTVMTLATSGGTHGRDSQQPIGNPRRHAHRLGRADRDGRRPRAARRRVSPGRRTATIR